MLSWRSFSPATQDLNPPRGRTPPDTGYIAKTLPPEILYDVIYALKTLCDSPVHVDIPNKRWLFVTHVCRFWRDTALTSPLLWQYIHITGNRRSDIPYLQTSLERSRNILVHIVVSARSLRKFDASCIMDLIEAHASQIATLELCPDNCSTHNRLDFLMPELESLTLCGCDDNDIWPQLVCGQLPRLRKLTLDRALAPWKWAPSQLAPLVSLSILGLQYGRWPSIDDFIFMLGSCTALETLTLHDAAPKLTWWNIGDEPRRLAILPSLRELELRGSIVDITTLITHLAPRMLRLITLNYCHADLGDALHAEEAVKQALRLLSRFSLMEMERLVLRLERHDRGPVAFITGCGHQQTPPCLVIHIDVNEIWPQSTSTVEGEEFESLLLHSLEGIPPLAPRRLDIEYIVPPQRMGVLSSRQWLRVFHCFPGITHLTIAGACAYVLLSELSISPSSSHRPLCPELKHLTFRAPSLDSASARALYRAVASRRVRNESLQTLTLNFRWPRTDHETHSLEQEIQTLRGLVEAENFHCSLQDTLQGL